MNLTQLIKNHFNSLVDVVLITAEIKFVQTASDEGFLTNTNKQY